MSSPLDDAINSGAGHSVPRVRSLPNTEHESLKHDKFCPISDPSAGVPYCGCARIEMIRRDEQRLMILRLDNIIQNVHASRCITWAYSDLDCDCYLGRAIRGESQQSSPIWSEAMDAD